MQPGLPVMKKMWWVAGEGEREGRETLWEVRWGARGGILVGGGKG